MFLAPANCQQYFTENSGTITNLGFDGTNTYPPNLKYSICIRRPIGAECIEYTSQTFQLYDQVPFPTCDLSRDFLQVPNTDGVNPIICGSEFGPPPNMIRSKLKTQEGRVDLYTLRYEEQSENYARFTYFLLKLRLKE